MSIRHFNGTTDELLMETGACNLTGAFTIAALVRFGNKGTEADIVTNRGESGGAHVIFYRRANNKLVVWIGGTNSEGPEVLEGSWYLLVVTKASGTVKPVFHVLKVGSAWTHIEGTAALPDAESTVAGTVAFGQVEVGSGEAFKGDVAAAAEWTRALSASEAEALGAVAALGEWSTKAPDGLWLFSQAAVATAVRDLAGRGAAQHSRTGTTVVAEEPPIAYGAEPALPEKAVRDRLEALVVLDTLKTVSGEEALGGDWEPEGGGVSDPGRKTTTGWTLTESLATAGARYGTPVYIGAGVIAAFDVPVLPAVDQTFELAIEGGAGIYLHKASATKVVGVGVYNTSRVIEESMAAIAAGDRWAFAWLDAATLQIWRRPTGGEWALVRVVDIEEGPTGSHRGNFAYVPRGVGGTKGRLANVSFEPLGTEPSPTRLFVDGEWVESVSKILVAEEWVTP